MGESLRAFNKELADVSENLIPHIDQIQYCSIGSGHTNAFLRQVKAGVRCVVGEPLSTCVDTGDTLSMELLKHGRPVFAEAVDKGLVWLVLHWQVPYVSPMFADVPQRMLNTTVQGKQGEIEVMMNLHTMAARQLAAGKEAIDWKTVESAACASLPQCAGWIGALTAYVKVNAGGTNGELLKELAAFAKSVGASDRGPTRTMGSEFLLRAAGMNWGKAVPDRWPTAIPRQAPALAN